MLRFIKPFIRSSTTTVFTYFYTMNSIQKSKPTDQARLTIWLSLVLVCCMFHSCFKDLPDKSIIYENDFEKETDHLFAIYGTSGLLDSTKITTFNNSKVLGRFNSNYILLQIDTIVQHNAIKIEFDLYMHDKWDGDHVPPGATYPDIWQMVINNFQVYLTTFSNGSFNQSFPANYSGTGANNKPRSNSWGTINGVCAEAGKIDGTTHYKIEYTTSHQGPLQLAINDIPNPVNSLCLKSWSLDNLRITAITYK